MRNLSLLVVAAACCVGSSLGFAVPTGPASVAAPFKRGNALRFLETPVRGGIGGLCSRGGGDGGGGRRGARLGLRLRMMAGQEEEELKRLMFEASQQRSRAAAKGSEERARKELIRSEIRELEASREAVVAKASALAEKLAANPQLAAMMADKLPGGSIEALVAKNPEVQRLNARVSGLEAELEALSAWGVARLALQEGGARARGLALGLRERPLLVLPGGLIGDHLKEAANEERFLTREELGKVESDLPFATGEWKQTAEGATLRRVQADLMREFSGSIVEAAREMVPIAFPGIQKEGNPLHGSARSEAFYEELENLVRICQYATAIGSPSFTDPDAAGELRELFRAVKIPPIVAAEAVRAMQKRACFLGQVSREAPNCWPACIAAFERIADDLEGPGNEAIVVEQ